MLENIYNNSMYTTEPPMVEVIWDMDYSEYYEQVHYMDIDIHFLDMEEREFEELLKHEPIGVI